MLQEQKRPISIKQARKLLGRKAVGLSDEQIIDVIDALDHVAAIVIDQKKGSRTQSGLLSW